VTQVGTASVSAQQLLHTLRSATGEGFTSAGGLRTSAVCHTHMHTHTHSHRHTHAHTHAHTRTHTQNVQSPLFSLCTFFLKLLLLLPAALQCEKGLVYEPCGPACSPSCPSVQHSPYSQCGVLSCVEGCFCPAGTVKHGKPNYIL